MFILTFSSTSKPKNFKTIGAHSKSTDFISEVFKKIISWHSPFTSEDISENYYFSHPIFLVQIGIHDTSNKNGYIVLAWKKNVYK
jgi:hypothetical protein